MKSINLNTHYYDGNIGKIYHKLVKIESEIKKKLYSYEKCLEIIDDWIKDINIKLNNIETLSAKNTLLLITTDIVNNHDKINNIYVQELLPRVIDIVSHFDVSGIKVFLQTFGEITSLGPCAQGRTTRLLQFYIPYI